MNFKKNINKFFKNKKRIKLVKSKLKFLTYLSPYLIILSYSFLLLEFYIYPGFLKSIFFFDSLSFTIFTIIITIISIFVFSKEKFNQSFSMVMEFNKLITPTLITLYFIFQAQEKNNYPNYVFAKFHIHPNYFVNIVAFGLSLVFLNIIISSKFLKSSIIKKVREIGILSFFSFLIIVLIILNKTLPVLLSVYQDAFIFTSFLRKHPNLTYEEKMYYRLGEIYSFFKFVSDNTPPDAKIGIPPQENPWLTEGNVGYVRNLVNPRTAISFGKNHVFDYTEPINYLIIASGSWGAHKPEDYGWPKSIINAEKIWYYDWSTGEVIESDAKIFDPTLPGENGRWGLIKINKNL